MKGRIRCAGCGKWVSSEEEGLDSLCLECEEQVMHRDQSYEGPTETVD